MVVELEVDLSVTLCSASVVASGVDLVVTSVVVSGALLTVVGGGTSLDLCMLEVKAPLGGVDGSSRGLVVGDDTQGGVVEVGS